MSIEINGKIYRNIKNGTEGIFVNGQDIEQIANYVEVDEENSVFTIGWKDSGSEVWTCYIEFGPDSVYIQGPTGVSIWLNEEQGIVFGGLPTEDPQIEGALWNDNGTLKISAGE